jgi:hypothetical protein
MKEIQVKAGTLFQVTLSLDTFMAVNLKLIGKFSFSFNLSFADYPISLFLLCCFENYAG